MCLLYSKMSRCLGFSINNASSSCMLACLCWTTTFRQPINGRLWLNRFLFQPKAESCNPTSSSAPSSSLSPPLQHHPCPPTVYQWLTPTRSRQVSSLRREPLYQLCPPDILLCSPPCGGASLLPPASGAYTTRLMLPWALAIRLRSGSRRKILAGISLDKWSFRLSLDKLYSIMNRLRAILKR